MSIFSRCANASRQDLPCLSPNCRSSRATFRGEFLEGIDLPDLPDFQAWCLAEREDLRRLQARILSMLIEGLANQPAAALRHARELVTIDPFNQAARASLLQILLLLGRQPEAERSFESAVRVFKGIGRDAEFVLQRTWRKLRETPAGVAGTVADDPADAVTSASAVPSLPPAPGKAASGLIGRESEWSRDAEAVRHANRVAGLPFDRVWLASPVFAYAMGQHAADWLEGKSIPQAMDILPSALTAANIAQYEADLRDPAAVYADPARRAVYLRMYGNICHDTRDQYVNFPWSSERK